MIYYDPGSWGIGFAFALRGSVIPKAVTVAMPVTVLAAVLSVLFEKFPQWRTDTAIGKEALDVFGDFTFILGFLIVFRSQQGYSRWWEGGTLLQQLRGEWFNSYSCLLAFCNSDPEKDGDVNEFQHQLARLYSLLFGCALQQVSTLAQKKFEVISFEGFNEDSLRFLQNAPDRCEVVLQWIQRSIVEKEANAVIKIAPPILSRVYQELSNGIVNLNNVRKITEFQIPFPLAQMITLLLVLHTLATPLLCVIYAANPLWASLITFVVTASFWSINFIAFELEMPFGDDENDLPLLEMQQDMNESLMALLQRHAQEVPSFDYDPELHQQLNTVVVNFDDRFSRKSGRIAVTHSESEETTKTFKKFWSGNSFNGSMGRFNSNIDREGRQSRLSAMSPQSSIGARGRNLVATGRQGRVSRPVAVTLYGMQRSDSNGSFGGRVTDSGRRISHWSASSGAGSGHDNNVNGDLGGRVTDAGRRISHCSVGSGAGSGHDNKVDGDLGDQTPNEDVPHAITKLRSKMHLSGAPPRQLGQSNGGPIRFRHQQHQPQQQPLPQLEQQLPQLELPEKQWDEQHDNREEDQDGANARDGASRGSVPEPVLVREPAQVSSPRRPGTKDLGDWPESQTSSGSAKQADPWNSDVGV